MKSSRFQRRTRGIKVVFLALFLFATIYLVFRGDFFKIKYADIHGATAFVGRSDLESLVKEVTFGKNILFLNKNDLKDIILTNFQGAKEVNVKKKFPSRLEINVVERKPLALVFNDQSQGYFLTDEEGYILGQIDEKQTSLPMIKYLGEVRVGYSLKEDLVPVYLKTLSALDKWRIGVLSVDAHDRYIAVVTSENIEVLFPVQKDKGNLVSILSNLLTKLKSEGKHASRIDLRYDKVV